MTHSLRSRLRGLLALSPIAVFLLVYLAASIAAADFYKMPLSVAFIVAAIWAMATMPRSLSIAERIDTFSRGAANTNVLYMIWIFILAGAFSALASGTGAVAATVDMMLAVVPQQWVLPGLFLTACFISMSIGTSVGTIVALAPIACEFAADTGITTPLAVSVVLGGSFFGDNLSFISDTTIAATRSLGVKMNDKFKTNLWIAVPAALIALAIYVVLGIDNVNAAYEATSSASWLLVAPYLIVILLALTGVNVTLVLLAGIASCLAIAFATLSTTVVDMCAMMGDGIAGMSDLIIVTLLAAGLLEVISRNGGIDCIINWLTHRINGPRGAQASLAFLVSLVNVCTANNTIAIITVGKISSDIADRFRLDRRKAASILDTCSCIVQSALPYGAQTLLAAGLAKVAPVAFLPYLYYPAALALMTTIAIAFNYPRRYRKAA